MLLNSMNFQRSAGPWFIPRDGLRVQYTTVFHLHRAPIPEEEPLDPLPGEEPTPDQEEPPPHPDPSITACHAHSKAAHEYLSKWHTQTRVFH